MELRPAFLAVAAFSFPLVFAFGAETCSEFSSPESALWTFSMRLNSVGMAPDKLVDVGVTCRVVMDADRRGGGRCLTLYGADLRRS